MCVWGLVTSVWGLNCPYNGVESDKMSCWGHSGQLKNKYILKWFISILKMELFVG